MERLLDQVKNVNKFGHFYLFSYNIWSYHQNQVTNTRSKPNIPIAIIDLHHESQNLLYLWNYQPACAIFFKFAVFSKAAGLLLSALKTEKLDSVFWNNGI